MRYLSLTALWTTLALTLWVECAAAQSKAMELRALPGQNLLQRLLVCGDGEPDVGEECDDGNTVSGDGCSATCQFEVVT